MTPWFLGIAGDIVVAGVCLALATSIVVPQVRARRRGVNGLGLATAGILLAVGVHFGMHGILSAAERGGDEAAWAVAVTVVADLTGMVAGIAYVVLRRRRATIVPRGQLFEDMEADRLRSVEQTALHEVAMAVAMERPADDVFAVVARTVSELFETESTLITRFEPTGARVVGAHGRHRGELGIVFPLDGDTALPRVAATGLAVRSRYADHPSDPVAAHARSEGYAAGFAAPVWVGARLWGALLVSTQDPNGLAGPDVEERLTRFADLVALAIANADTRALLNERAATDPLTGLANHRTFHERLASEVSRARRHGGQLSVLVLDIDHFKSVNDTHGHAVGDQVLIEVSRRMRNQVRTEDLVARIGGEEFAVLLPATGERDALRLAERIAAAVRDVAFPEVGRVTVSSGVCSLDRARDAEDLLRLADGALYWAKAHGRDMAVRYAPEVVTALSAEERAEGLLRRRALAALGALAQAIDAKDRDTQEHSERVAEIAVVLGAEMGWTTAELVRLRQAALLHDVGKIGVPDRILTKAGPLTRDEEAGLADHAVLGARILGEVLDPEQVQWVRHHHERWTGGGYPDDLAGTEIPEGARILAVADAWDALTSGRPHSVAGPLSDSPDLSAGRFDPRIVESLARVVDRGDLRGDADRPRPRRRFQREG